MDVAVVGGGPAGLATAYRLGRNDGVRVRLLERAAVLGGLAAGFRHDGFVLDYGPHRLHAETHPDILRDLRHLLGDELRARRRRGLIYLGGRFVPYPLGLATVARLPVPLTARLAGGALTARLRRSGNRLPKSFREAVEGRAGRPLYDLFYRPYAEKVWGLPGEAIAAEQADRRVNQRGPADFVRALAGRGTRPFYYYPDGGFGRIPEAYATALDGLPGVSVAREASVEAIRWDGSRIRAITYRAGGQSIEQAVDHLVWTAPVTTLLRLFDPPLTADLSAAAGDLRYRAIVLVYLVLDCPRAGRADTYYFPEAEFPFSRVIEQKNFSPHLAPPDRTVLGLDIACNPGDRIYSAGDDELAALVLPGLKRAGLVDPRGVSEVFSRRFPQAYPVYPVGYEAVWQRVLDRLNAFDNLWLAGRQGLFLHNNTHHSLLMGYRAADAIARSERATWPAAIAEFNRFRVAD